MPIAYQFLPWVRRGLAVALDVEDNLGVGAGLEARGSAHVGVKLAGPHAGEAIAPLQLRLHGPGDVIGIDSRIVVRTDPKPNATNFEPNYLPIVDFDPPDFPWMLTPARAQDDRRLRPWLVLVVFEVAKTKRPRLAPGALLPSITVKAADVKKELPDLSESWSWAHAQLVNDNAAAIGADLKNRPASNISRLVCPRRLQERTDYVACVVPAFEPGRLRGLGQVPKEDAPEMGTIAPAWDVAANPIKDVTLPVYHWWEFSTSAKGDFESLARRLRTPTSYKGTPVEDLLANIGTIPMSVDDLLNGPTPGLKTTMEGALVPIKYEAGTPPADVQAESLEIIVNTPQEQVVNPVSDGADGKRLEVKPPMYGAWHAKQHQVFRPGAGPLTAPTLGSHWLADLNLNPRYRGAAGYGAEVVRKNQEAYVDACWDQIGDILTAEMKFNLTRLAIEALGALKRRYYDALPPERLLQLFGPALSRIEAFGTPAETFRIQGKVASLGGRLSRTSMPSAMVDPAMRRVASPANRSLRIGARLNRTTAALPSIVTGYVATMARATQKPAAFAVNAFTPDGILSTKLFDGVALGNAPQVDLSSIGLGRSVNVADVKQMLASARVAERTLATRGVPDLKVREGDFGVITDLHVERFGTLMSLSPNVRPVDWLKVSTELQSRIERGVDGFLIESVAQTGLLQVSSVRIDPRTGSLVVNRVTRRFDEKRKSLTLPRPAADEVTSRAEVALGRIDVGVGRPFNAGGLLAGLPPNALNPAAGAAGQNFRVNPNFEIERIPGAVGVTPGASVTVTVPPAFRAPEVVQRFARATTGAQTTWRDAFVGSRVRVQVLDLPLVQVASVLRARIDPAVTLPLRLASSVSIAKAGLDQSGSHISAFLPDRARLDHRFMIPRLFDRVMAWPHLRNPFYKDLAEYDKNAFMPGVDDLPPDLIMLVQINQYFIDALMTGANVEMNRELLWRGFPTDLRGTPFQVFWGRRGVVNGQRQFLDDMEPIHQWRRQPLGERTDENMTDPNRIALLVRGQLLLRYPNTAVYAWKRTQPVPPGNQPQLLKDASGNPPDDAATQEPIFSGFIPPDITFFGFDIDKEQIADWCFVLEEQMTEPRFGFDVDEPAPGQAITGAAPRAGVAFAREKIMAGQAVTSGGTFNAYKALSWAHVGVEAGQFTSVAKLITPPNLQGFNSFPALQANATAADIATTLLQLPFRAYWVGDDLDS